MLTNIFNVTDRSQMIDHLVKFARSLPLAAYQDVKKPLIGLITGNINCGKSLVWDVFRDTILKNANLNAQESSTWVADNQSMLGDEYTLNRIALSERDAEFWTETHRDSTQSLRLHLYNYLALNERDENRLMMDLMPETFDQYPDYQSRRPNLVLVSNTTHMPLEIQSHEDFHIDMRRTHKGARDWKRQTTVSFLSRRLANHEPIKMLCAEMAPA